MRALEQSKTRDEIVVLHLHMELLESEFDKMMEVNPEQSLHTQISETKFIILIKSCVLLSKCTKTNPYRKTTFLLLVFQVLRLLYFY